MSISCKCKCGKTLKLGDESAGKKAQCPACSAVFQVPAPTSTPDPTARKPFGDEDICADHPGEAVTMTCVQCGRPICRLCQQAYGFFCSAACKNATVATKVEKTPEQKEEEEKLRTMREKIRYWMKIIFRIVLPSTVAVLVLIIILKHKLGGGKLVWQFKPSHDKPFSAITVGDNFLLAGCGDGFLYSVDRESGETRWTFEAGTRLDAVKPLLPTPDLCVTCTDKVMYGVNTADGSLAWEYAIEGKRQGQPIHSGDVVCYVADFYRELTREEMTERREQLRQRPGDDVFASVFSFGSRKDKKPKIWTGAGMFGVSLADGTETWVKRFNKARPGRFLAGEKLLYYSQSEMRDGKFTHALVALDPASGKGKWKASIAGGSISRIVPVDKALLLLTQDHLYLISYDGKAIWSKTWKKSGLWGAVVGEGKILCKEGEKQLACLDLATGEKLWDTEVRSLSSRPIVGRDLVFLTDYVEEKREKGGIPDIKPPGPRTPGLDAKGILDEFATQIKDDTKFVPVLNAFDGRTGELEWTRKGTGGHMLYSDGKLYAMTTSAIFGLATQQMQEFNYIKALRASSGRQLWTYQHKGTVTSFAIEDRSLFFGSSSGASSLTGGMTAAFYGRKKEPKDNAIYAVYTGR